ncbi:MAG: SPFH/Band 7/PHB domain protein [Gemmataceae bacterium]|nr:SPFH/Band 7/PHB domain protein [Gemmataceae bacterium]
MDVGSVVALFMLVLILALVGVLAWASVRVVREYQRLVVFRLGRCLGARGPGLVLLIPGVDRGVWADLREQYLQVPHQTCITRDNAPVNVDCLIYMYVVDPVSSVVQVQNYLGAAQGIAMTTLRAVVGDISLDDVLAKREQINLQLRSKLDEVTERWGVKVNSVEIREIIPPREVQEAMNRQMSAERNRRALVTEAEGKREAAVTVATGEKQAAILASEGARQSAILRAEGAAQALETVYSVAQAVDAKTMSLQYLDTLRALGGGQSTKIVIPMEFTQMLQPLLNMTAGASAAQGPATPAVSVAPAPNGHAADAALAAPEETPRLRAPEAV